MMVETLILVNENDVPCGTEEKLQAHVRRLKHRAFSVIIYNDNGEMLIQKRASTKYHSAGLWANTCCGHPRPTEDTQEAAKRRLGEELGFSCDLQPITTVSYNLHLENGLYENEYTHVFKGQYKGGLDLNPEEVEQVAWQKPEDVLSHALANKDLYARWFRLYLFKFYKDIF